MTKAEYRARLKQLHPDLNGGDASWVSELQKLVEEHREANRTCACGCGLKPRKVSIYASVACAVWHRFYANKIGAAA